MKNSIILLITIPVISLSIFLSNPKESKNNNHKTKKQELIDENLMKREIKNAALEAAKEFGIDPDSTYIPYKDSDY